MDEDHAEDVLLGAMMRTHTYPPFRDSAGKPRDGVDYMFVRMRMKTFVGDIKRHPCGKRSDRTNAGWGAEVRGSRWQS